MHRVLRSVALVMTFGLISMGGAWPAHSQEMFGSLVELHGYLETIYYNHETDGDVTPPYTTSDSSIRNFDVHHFALFIGGQLRENLRYTTEFHYAHPPKAGLLIPQANIELTIAEPLVVTTGVFWFPFGTLEERKVYSPLFRLVTFPYTIVNLLPWHYSDVGVKVGGKVLDDMIKYSVAFSNGTQGLDSSSANEGRDNNSNKRVTGRLAIIPIDGLMVGGSYSTGKWDDADDADLTFWGFDAIFVFGPLELQGEYIKGDVENPAGATPELEDVFGALNPGDFERDSYYVEASYTILQARDLIDRLALVVRYDTFDRDDRDDEGDRDRVALGVAYSPYQSTLLKVEYDWIDEDEGDLDNDAFWIHWIIDF